MVFPQNIIIIDNNVLISNTSIIILIFSWKERNKWPWFIWWNWGIPICMYCYYCIIYYYTYLGHGCKFYLSILSLIQNYWKMFKTMQFFKMWQKFQILKKVLPWKWKHLLDFTERKWQVIHIGSILLLNFVEYLYSVCHVMSVDC